jgi:hypothetical protein
MDDKRDPGSSPRSTPTRVCFEFRRRGYTAIRDLVSQPRFICGSCSRASRAAVHLCDPRKL